MNTQPKTIEAKKDEFRTYLEKTGVVDQLTRVLVSLYEENERPQNTMDYIKKNLNSPDDIDSDNLKSEYLKLKIENDQLKKKIEDLTKEIEIYKNS
jgi:hypothetical protein